VNEISIVAIELIGGGIITAGISVVGWYLKRLVAQMDKQKEDRERHEQDMMLRIGNLEQAIMEMQNAESERMAREQQRLAQEAERMAEFSKFQDGIKAVLRDRILQSRRYFCEKGYIPAQEFENIEQMHNSYAAMGGNGLAHRAFIEISNLPFEPQTDE